VVGWLLVGFWPRKKPPVFAFTSVDRNVPEPELGAAFASEGSGEEKIDGGGKVDFVLLESELGGVFLGEQNVGVGGGCSDEGGAEGGQKEGESKERLEIR
ncbi:12580_t:CDS:2, partial [Acaulospora colombiana]